MTFYPVGFSVPFIDGPKFIYRNFPRGIEAFTFGEDRFESYGMYRPKPFINTTLEGENELAVLVARGPVLLFSTTPTLARNLLPQGARATLLYSELPFADHAGIAEFGTRTIALYDEAGRQVALPPLKWITLFRIERTGFAGIENKNKT